VAAANPPIDNYRRFRAVALLMLFMVIFGLLWLQNGDWTATYLVGAIAISLAAGWAIHLVVSATELAGPILRPFFVGLPAWIPGILIVLTLPFGVLDVLSSAIGITAWLEPLRLEGLQLDLVRTLAGLLVAFLPERMLYYLSLALARVVKG
jgi:hypothetical protein